jgi:hypothetical protein
MHIPDDSEIVLLPRVDEAEPGAGADPEDERPQRVASAGGVR